MTFAFQNEEMSELMRAMNEENERLLKDSKRKNDDYVNFFANIFVCL